MGNFSEHILFGLVSALTFLYVLKGFIDLSLSETVISASLILIGSVLPDIDHKNSYIHRSVKSALSICFGISLIFISNLRVQYTLLIGLIGFSSIYFLISSLKIRHRGFTHSISFAIIVSSMVFTLGVFYVSSFAPGMAVAIGILSHLVLDGEMKLR